MLRGSLDGRGAWERMDTRTHMAGSLRCPPETITTLLISSTPRQTKKLKKKKTSCDSSKGIHSITGLGIHSNTV